MEKRIVARGIIYEDDAVYLMFRRKKHKNGKIKEYYVIPGGGLENNEAIEETVVRELKEELSVDTKPKEYLGFLETKDTISHFFDCEILNGVPTLGGEELIKCSDDNYYEVRKVKLKDLLNLKVVFKDVILKNKER